MLLELSTQFTTDIAQLKAENSKLPAKVWELIFDILKSPQNPLSGIGKPEALKGDLSGYYSRRITDKHRLIYKFVNGILYLVSCFGHYSDK
jgi:toxin YoeB